MRHKNEAHVPCDVGESVTHARKHGVATDEERRASLCRVWAGSAAGSKVEGAGYSQTTNALHV